jgi:hypothetical protein
MILLMMTKKPRKPYHKNNTPYQKEKSKTQHRKNENQTKHRKKNATTIHNTKKYIPKDTTQIENEYTFKKSLLKCGDIESNPGPRPIPLFNHPQEHVEKQKTYFFHKTSQIKPEYNHIMDLFKLYLNHTHTSNINPHLTQFCRDNNHCPESYLFYAILTTLAPTPTQCNQLIEENSTQWTTNLIKNLMEHPHPLSTDQHKLIKFYSENEHIIKPPESIQKELYSFITNEQPNMTTIQHKFPYLPEQMILEALKCLQPIPNFTHPEPIQNHPPINPRHILHTNLATKILSWNCGTLNTTLPGLQALTNKSNPPSIIAIQETKISASKSTKYLNRLFPQYKMIFNNTTTTTQTRRIQGQPYNTNPSTIRISREYHKNTHHYKHLAISPNNKNHKPSTTYILPDTHVYAHTY